MPGVGVTGLPLIAMIESPTLKPAPAAGDCGSMAVMAPSVAPFVLIARPEYPSWLLMMKPACSKRVTHFLTMGAAMGPIPVQGAVAPCGFTSSFTICAVVGAAVQANTVVARK